MPFKDPEIYKALKIIGNKELSEKGKFPPGMIYILRDYGIVSKSSLYLTSYGLSLKEDYEEKKETFGKKNVEFRLTMIRDKPTYKVWVNPNAKSRAGKAEPEIPQDVSEPTEEFGTQLPETISEISETFEENNEMYEQRKEHITEFLSEFEFLLDLGNKSKPIKGIEDREGSKGEKLLIVTTIINYHRTKKERELLDKIAGALKMKIETKNEPWDRRYCFETNDGETPITLVSRKDSKKGFGSYEPLEIEINLDEPVEESEEFIKTLIKEFSEKKA